jgi:hypothetical protein
MSWRYGAIIAVIALSFGCGSRPTPTAVAAIDPATPRVSVMTFNVNVVGVFVKSKESGK